MELSKEAKNLDVIIGAFLETDCRNSKTKMDFIRAKKVVIG